MVKNILGIEDLGGGTYNQTIKKIIKLESGVKKIVVRKESNFLNKQLINEIEFLLSLSQEARSHFPQVEEYCIDKLPIFYEMPYYNLKTMREGIMRGDIDLEYCVKLIQNVLDFMFREVFSQNIECTGSEHLIKRAFLRVKRRHEQLCCESDIIKKVIKAETIIIEGKKHKNVSEMVKWLTDRAHIIKKLTPKVTHMIHGDFHFDNFLIDTNDPSKFVLIDPRGERKGFDYAYDLGKLWHSFHGLYDFIHEGLFEMEYEVNDDLVEVDIFKPKESKALGIYGGIYDKRGKFIDMCIQNMNEDNAEIQILFNEAVHFCALAPFHLKNDGIEKLALCRYFMGVKLLNEFIDGLR